MLPVAILAGGLATRLRPLTERVPKALLTIAGRPFIFHQLELLKNEGIDRVVLCVGHLGDQINAAVGDGRACGLSIQYSFDGRELLGTGGALKKALPLLGESFFALNGDSYLRCSFARIQSAYEAARRPALMTVLRNDNRWDKSNVLFKNGKIIEYAKNSPRADMAYIDFGLSIISRGVFEDHAGPTGDLSGIFQDLAATRTIGRIRGFGAVLRSRFTAGRAGHRRVSSAPIGGCMSYTQTHLQEAAAILQKLDVGAIEKMAALLAEIKFASGRVFFLGVGGSAANCSHAVNDFRKLAGIECYAPTDNVAELTARINDDGWESAFAEWLKVSRLGKKDAVFILSVGGGSVERNISPNLVAAVRHAKTIGSRILGILGRDGGHTAKMADAAVIIPTVNPHTVTPHAEAFQSLIWHLLVSHPLLKANETKWESVDK